MYKLTPALVLSAFLLFLSLLFPTVVCADIQKILMLTDGTDSATEQLLLRTGLFASWQCDFHEPDETFAVQEYTHVIICISPDHQLPDSLASDIRAANIPAFIIGEGSLEQFVRTVSVEGTVTAHWDNNTTLTALNRILLPQACDEEISGKLYVDNTVYPLCCRVGQITHLACFIPDSDTSEASLINLLQDWLWPYENEPTAYSQFFVVDNVYPFSDLEQLLAIADMFASCNVPWNICVMPYYMNADFPSVKRFCEVLSYLQSLGVGIVLHVPLVSLENQDIAEVQQKLITAYEAYAMYGIYPIALEIP